MRIVRGLVVAFLVAHLAGKIAEHTARAVVAGQCLQTGEMGTAEPHGVSTRALERRLNDRSAGCGFHFASEPDQGGWLDERHIGERNEGIIPCQHRYDAGGE